MTIPDSRLGGMSRTTPLDPGRVAAASAAWVWVPDQARTVETEEFLLVRYPDWFFHQLELARFTPVGDLVDALDAAIATARTFDVPELVPGPGSAHPTDWSNCSRPVAAWSTRRSTSSHST